MKALKFLIAALVALCCASCGESKMTPVSEKINGPLKDYFEVVVREYAATKDGKVGVEFRRIAEGFPEPWNEDMEVGYSDGYFEPQFTVEFQDADGNVLSKDDTDIVRDKDELKAIAALGVDETATVMFDCGKGAKQFKVGSSFEFHGEIEQTVSFDGAIGKYPIVMTLHIAPNRKVTGAYYYKRSGRGNYLYVKGKKNNDRITLDEFTKDGEHTGAYDGTYRDGTYGGRFEAKSGTYEFDLYHADVEPIDFSRIDFSAFSKPAPPVETSQQAMADDEAETSTQSAVSGYGSSASGSKEVDALLDKYERIVNRTISCYAKAMAGDPTALVEYTSLMQELQTWQESMSEVSEDMSASQVSRFTDLMNRLTTQMQQ